MNNPKLIAFYLPQFHPIPENDEWWGKGFTEWTNVSKAKPLFAGHYQPHLPADLGFYDLRLKETRHAQVSLAKQYGIDGFCYHYYWFSGRRLLERPFNDMLADPDTDMPFCICWANENWTRRWDGAENELLIAQNYTDENDSQFINDLIPALKDPRYIKIDNAPFILVYRPQSLPDPKKTLTTWREIAKKEGIPNLKIYCALILGEKEYERYGFDGGVEFPPHNIEVPFVNDQITFKEKFDGGIYNYEDIANQFLKTIYSEKQIFNTVFPSWDNSSRRGHSSHIILNSTPNNFEYWLSQTILKTKSIYPNKDSLVFINAWNEWAEGCHLEPDKKYGLQFLEAVQKAKKGDSKIDHLTSNTLDISQEILLNGITFRIISENYQDLNSTKDRFVLLKTAAMVEKMYALKSSLDPKYIFDLGIYKGGSCALYNELYQPEKLVAIDFNMCSDSALTQYIEENNLENKIKPYYQTNQADHNALEAICTTEFGHNRLDLIIDDASHFYEESKASFNTLFPKLREGGIYIIEDWAWAHWPGEWQKNEGYFKDKRPLSVLIIEILMASASNSPNGFIKNIKIVHNAAYIERGSQRLDESFDISQRYLTRGEPYGSFDPRYRRPTSALKAIQYVVNKINSLKILKKKY